MPHSSNKFLDHRGRPRIVVTGIGALTPLGNDAVSSWHNALAGNSGISRITQFDARHLPCQIAGEVKHFKPSEHMDGKMARRMARGSQLALAAGVMALADAGLSAPVADPERTAVCIGTGYGGLDFADREIQNLRTKGVSRTSPFAIISSVPNMPSHYVSIMAGTTGPISTVVAACATGVQAIGEGMEFIRRGSADVALVGGTEGLVHETAVGGFSAMRALAINYNDAPEKASRPFSIDRDGFVLSEGAGVLVVESLEHATKRGAKIYAELHGHASSSDAHHVAQPDPNGAGLVRSMKWAMKDADKSDQPPDYVNAHGAGTIGDVIETIAMKTYFGNRAYDIPMSSTKSIMGHAMGGAGAIETIMCIYALQHQIVPPTWNLDNPDPECDLDYVPNAPREASLELAMCNALGLGGQNASLLIGRYDN